MYQGATNIGSVTTGTSFQVTELTADTAYSFTVYARDGATNTSVASDPENVTTSSELDTEAPSAPTNLLASNITQTTVDLSWDASTDNVAVTSYDVYQGATNIGSVTTGTSFQVTELTADTAYSFTVYARDGATNTSVASDPENVTTLSELDTEAPSAPTNLLASNITQTTVDLSWDASTDNVAVTSYDVYQGATNIGSVTTGTSFQVTELTADTAYSFTVYARDGATNTSVASDPENVTTLSELDTEAPSAPTNLLASNITQTTVDLSWDASTDNVAVTSYDVYQGSTNIGSVTTGTSFQVTELTADTAYSFTVYARDGATNTSVASDPENVTTLSELDTEAPSKPTNLLASNITQTTVDLSWDASTDNVAVTSYDVYQGSTNIGSVTTGTSFQVTELTADTAYSFTVYARDDATNTSDPSNTENVTTQSSGGGDSTVLNEGFFESGWDGWVDGGSDAYRYSGSRAYEGSYAIRLRDNTNSSVMTLSNINVSSYNNINIEFYFYARSMENGEDFWVQYYDGSSWNTVATYTSGTDFSNNTFYNASVNISSTDYNFTSNTQFRFRCDASGNNDQIYIDQVTITGNSGFSPLTTYINSLGRDINNILGNEGNEIDYESDFLLYPNPAKSNISIKLTTESNYITYHIFNMIGQEVLSGVLENETIKVDSLQAGVYFMKINDGEEQMIQRFIKE